MGKYLPPVASLAEIKVGQIWQQLGTGAEHPTSLVIVDTTIPQDNPYILAKEVNDVDGDIIEIHPFELLSSPTWVQLAPEEEIVAPVAKTVAKAKPTAIVETEAEPLAPVVANRPRKLVYADHDKPTKPFDRAEKISEENFRIYSHVTVDKKRVDFTQSPFTDIDISQINVGHRPEAYGCPQEIRPGQVFLSRNSSWTPRVVVTTPNERGHVHVLELDANGHPCGNQCRAVKVEILRTAQYWLVWDGKAVNNRPVSEDAPQQVPQEAPQEAPKPGPAPGPEPELDEPVDEPTKPGTTEIQNFDALVNLDGGTEVPSGLAETFSYSAVLDGEKIRLSVISNREMAIVIPTDKEWINRNFEQVKKAATRLTLVKQLTD